MRKWEKWEIVMRNVSKSGGDVTQRQATVQLFLYCSGWRRRPLLAPKFWAGRPGLNSDCHVIGGYGTCIPPKHLNFASPECPVHQPETHKDFSIGIDCQVSLYRRVRRQMSVTYFGVNGRDGTRRGPLGLAHLHNHVHTSSAAASVALVAHSPSNSLAPSTSFFLSFFLSTRRSASL